MDPRSDEGIFLGYAQNSAAYRVYNLRTKTVMESANVIFDEETQRKVDSISLEPSPSRGIPEGSRAVSDPPLKDESDGSSTDTGEFDDNLSGPDTSIPVHKNHSPNDLIGDLQAPRQTRHKPRINYQDMVRFVCFNSQIEPKKEELEQFVRNDVWVDLTEEPTQITSEMSNPEAGENQKEDVIEEVVYEDAQEKDGVNDERTIIETLKELYNDPEKEDETETQSRAPEISLPNPVSSDDSDSPLIILQQKAKARNITRKRKGTSAHGRTHLSNVQRAQRRKTTRKGKGTGNDGPSEPSAPHSETGVKPLSDRFLSVETKKRFDKFKGVDVIAERNVNVMDFRKNYIWNLFEERQLTGTMTYACAFSKLLVREFYANLTQRTDIPGDFMHHKTFVRGRFIEFSPTVINRLLGTPDNASQGLDDLPEGTSLEDLEVALTGEYLTERNGKIPIICLKFESRVMHLIGKTNWLPTRRSDVIQDELALLIFKLLRKEDVNFGSIIYSHILSRAEDMRMRYLLPHPCLIQSIIVRQSPEILADSEITEVIQRPLVIEARRKNTKIIAQICAPQHALWEEFQRGESESGAPSSSVKDKGKGKMGEDEEDEVASEAEKEEEEGESEETGEQSE
ncbi:PREDICTED: uncharacterized protein LOC104807865 [Tarenaya hassleriana]|uniref:uncharacterized protein LOC104807865 n=1 Tax=Tarenaya hassleriana TaxID=28532 RepID=UPI00053C1980|nr:PREDICTED: uncharacterized protein LOC104807865 [Tarenaya hassleriana]